MSLSLSKEKLDLAKRNKFDKPEFLAMADLLLMGWSEMDAYIIAFSPSKAYDKTFIKNRVKSIMSNPAIKNYINSRGLIMNSGKEKEINKEDFKPLTKEEVLMQLQSLLRKSISPKERTEILMKISDLMRFKDEVTTEDDSRVYYMPRKCYSCEWYKGREKDKIE